MSQAIQDTITCSSCGKSYLVKPEFAGRKLKCKCGAVISMPPAPVKPAPKPAPRLPVPPGVDDLYEMADDAPPAAARRPAAKPAAAGNVLDDAYRCPSCNETMEPGSIICSHCGFNLKTGEKTQRPRATGMAAGSGAKGTSAAAGAYGNAARTQVADQPTGGWKKLVGAAVVLILLFVGGFVAYRHFSHASMRALINTGKGDDPKVIDKADNDGAHEIHDWFKENPNRMTGEWSPKQALYHADELQKMGALRVLTFGGTTSLNVAVELPEDAGQRKQLFAWENKFAIEHRYKPATDVGQRWLLLVLNL